jgi:hypothetical protein
LEYRRTNTIIFDLSEVLIAGLVGIENPLALQLHLPEERESSTFHTVLEAIHREPQDCLFIDDSLTNVRVAKGVGIPGICFTNAEQLRAELETTP